MGLFKRKTIQCPIFGIYIYDSECCRSMSPFFTDGLTVVLAGGTQSSVFFSLCLSACGRRNCHTMAGGDESGGPVACITHVVFDMDGLLLDTENFYSVVQEKILARYGKKFEWSLKAKMMGKKALEAGQILVKDLGLEGVLTPEEFIAERESMLQVMFPESELMPGAERLIRHLHAHGVPMAVATSSHQRHFDLKTTKHGELFWLMHHVVVGDDPAVTKGKPAPDIFLTAVRRFEEPGVDAKNVLVFEDAPTGVAAARAAQMPVVMVPDPRLDKSLQQDANQILSSLLDFDPSFWGLPAFKG